MSPTPTRPKPAAWWTWSEHHPGGPNYPDGRRPDRLRVAPVGLVALTAITTVCGPFEAEALRPGLSVGRGATGGARALYPGSSSIAAAEVALNTITLPRSG